VSEGEKWEPPCALWFFCFKGRGVLRFAFPKPKEGAAFFGFRGWRLRWFFFIGLGFLLFFSQFFSAPHACKFFSFPVNQFFSPSPKNFSPCLLHCSMIFIGKVLLGFQTSPSTFPFFFFYIFFFVNFGFSYFFVFLKTSNINVNSTRKITDHKIYALKVERVPNIFENFNSFEMTLKMLKRCKYIKNTFFGVFIVFCLFLIFF